MNIKIKKTLQPIIVKDKILFGFGNRNIERSINNTKKNRQVIRFLNCEVSRENINISDTELSSIIQTFRDKGLLTTNDYSDKDRYSRNKNFFEWIDKSNNVDPQNYQDRIVSSRVAVVGLGGVGANVTEQLVRVGVKNLILVDFDDVDSSNISRQSTYFEADIGKPKNTVCAQYLKKINSEVNIELISNNIKDQKDVDDIYNKKPSLVINCADKPLGIDIWFDKASTKYNVPVVFGSYASTTINTIAKVPDQTVNISDFLDQNAISPDTLIDCSFPAAVIAPATFMVAGMVSYYAVMILTRLRKIDKAVQIDMDGWDLLKYDISRK